MTTCLKNNFHNQEAEEAILGTIIMNNAYLLRVYGLLKEEHFYFQELGKTYSHIVKTIESSVANSITLKDFFENELKNPSLLRQLIIQASDMVDIKHYALKVIELWQKRQLEEMLENIDLNNDFETTKNLLLNKVYEIEVVGDKEPKTIQQASDEMVDKLAKGDFEYMDTGFKNLDALIGGIERGNLIVTGGKSSSGKTTFTLCLAKELSRKYKVLFFSVEVSTPAITRKFITNLQSINPTRLKRGNLIQSEVQSLNNRKLDEFKLSIDETKGLTLGKIRAKLNKIFLKDSIDFIFIDFLQIMVGEKKEFSREQEVSKIIIGLKQIALDYNIAVVVLSQLSRGSDSRDNKKPILSDLRDSGSIEQMADLVLFVHREAYYLQNIKPDEKQKPAEYAEWLRIHNAIKNDADIILAKNRDGTIGSVKMFFDGEFSRFTEINNI